MSDPLNRNKNIKEILFNVNWRVLKIELVYEFLVKFTKIVEVCQIKNEFFEILEQKLLELYIIAFSQVSSYIHLFH